MKNLLSRSDRPIFFILRSTVRVGGDSRAEQFFLSFCVFMSGGHSTNLIINRKLSARLHKHAVRRSYYGKFSKVFK
jgi:hypothetical protein